MKIPDPSGCFSGFRCESNACNYPECLIVWDEARFYMYYSENKKWKDINRWEWIKVTVLRLRVGFKYPCI